MRIKDAIEQVEIKVPGNTHGHPELIRWLSALDGEIFGTLYQQREKPPVSDWSPYDPMAEGVKDTVLLAQAPYDDLYVTYLVMMIHREDGDDMAVNDTDDYNSRYYQFRSAYARKHRGITPRWSFF